MLCSLIQHFSFSTPFAVVTVFAVAVVFAQGLEERSSLALRLEERSSSALRDFDQIWWCVLRSDTAVLWL